MGLAQGGSIISLIEIVCFFFILAAAMSKDLKIMTIKK